MSNKTPIFPSRGEECLSDLDLDQLQCGELEPHQSRPLLRHLENCGDCQKRREQLLQVANFDSQAAWDRLSLKISAGDVHANVEQALQHTPPSEQEQEPAPKGLFERYRWPILLAGLASAATLVLLVVLQQPNTIRSKGGLQLRIYRANNSAPQQQKAEQVLSGARFAAGDRLQFELDLPKAGQIMVVGVEASGSLYPAYPSSGPPISRAIGSGQKQMLRDAIQLDDSVGVEWLILVFCRQPFAMERLSWSAQRLNIPKGCSSVPFKLVKQ